MDHTIYEILILNANGEPLLAGDMGRGAIEQTLVDYHLCYDEPHMLLTQAVAEEGFLKLSNGYHLIIKPVTS